jgi:thymidylate synthase
MHVEADTLDDLLRTVFRRLLRSKNRPSPTKGPNREQIGALLTLRRPRARFSRTEQRATLLSCLGETLWYLSGSASLNVIEYYIPHYRSFANLPPDASAAEGAYGPRLFGDKGGIDQVERVIQALKQKHDTRQAVIQIFDKTDFGRHDVPCTCNVQFLARGRLVHCYVSMRSNDAYLGLPHDVFAFSFLQELVARSIGHDVGSYHHAVSSLHLYDQNEDAARSYISEGWQSTIEMPPMPNGNPWPAVQWLLKTEQAIRMGAREIECPKDVDKYWSDLARLLLVKALYDDKDMRGIVREQREFGSQTYLNFIRGREQKLATTAAPQLRLLE